MHYIFTYCVCVGGAPWVEVRAELKEVGSHYHVSQISNQSSFFLIFLIKFIDYVSHVIQNENCVPLCTKGVLFLATNSLSVCKLHFYPFLAYFPLASVLSINKYI